MILRMIGAGVGVAGAVAAIAVPMAAGHAAIPATAASATPVATATAAPTASAAASGAPLSVSLPAPTPAVGTPAPHTAEPLPGMATQWFLTNNVQGVRGTAGAAVCTVEVGSFTGPTPDPSAYTATITWGDGSATSVGEVAASGDGALVVVTPCHTYVTAGTWTIAAAISMGSAPGGRLVTSADITGGAAPLPPQETATAGTPLCTIEIAAVPAASPLAAAAPLRAAVRFGDGTGVHAASVVPASGGSGYLVTYGCHIFATAGTFQSWVYLHGNGGVVARLVGPRFDVVRA